MLLAAPRRMEEAPRGYCECSQRIHFVRGFSMTHSSPRSPEQIIRGMHDALSAHLAKQKRKSAVRIRILFTRSQSPLAGPSTR